MLRDLKRRGMRPPVVAVGDGALGFWAAVRDVWPKTREQRDWFHKLGNILDKLPKRLQPRVKAALREVIYAEVREQAREAITRFATEYGPKYPKAVTTLEKDTDVLLTFFDFPAEHWKHLRTSNVIESPFATVRLRQRVTKGAGSRTKGLLMAYKLLDRRRPGGVGSTAHTCCPSSGPASASWTASSRRARRMVPVALPPVYIWLEAQEPGPVLEIPASSRPDAGYVLWSAWHGLPLVNGYSGYTPAGYPLVVGLAAQSPARSRSERFAGSRACAGSWCTWPS